MLRQHRIDLIVDATIDEPTASESCRDRRAHLACGVMSSSPHDALFKDVLGQLEPARGFLRWALPAPVVETIAWQTLARCPANFIDAELTERNADLLFSASYRDG